MFVALRDLRAARGRFALITLVVVLVAVLVSFLSGLASGLAQQNVSALRELPGDTVVFADTGTAPSFDSSALTADQVRTWRQAAHADPVGISRARAGRDSGPAGTAGRPCKLRCSAVREQHSAIDRQSIPARLC